jgi:hypothetical protein
MSQQSPPVSEDQVKQLYQWFSKRASFFRSDTAGSYKSRTVRTEMTVQVERMTVLVGSAGPTGFDICPLCGNELARAEAERLNCCPHKGSISQASGPVAGPNR